MNLKFTPPGSSGKTDYYKGMTKGFTLPEAKDTKSKKLIALAKKLIKMRSKELPRTFDPKKIEKENQEWWPTHCEALRQGKGDILAQEYRDELVYLCADGPMYGREEGTKVEGYWWERLSKGGVQMYWPLVQFSGEVVYFEWMCIQPNGETAAQGNVTFLRRGHAGGIYLKTEKFLWHKNVL